MALSDEELDWLEEQKKLIRKNDHSTAQTMERVTGDPDRIAEEAELAESTGLPVETVQNDIEEARRKKQLKLLGLEDLPERSPRTAEYLNDDLNAAISSDDIGTLEKIESLYEESQVSFKDVAINFPAGLIEEAGRFVGGAGEIYGAYSRSVNKLLGVNKLQDYLNQEHSDNIGLKALSHLNTALDIGGSLRYTGGKIKGVGRTMDLTEEERSSLGYWQNVGVDVVKGTGQLTGQILTAVFAPLLSPVQLLSGGADQAAERQKASGTYGQSGVTDAGLITGAAITFGTEKWGLDKLLNRIPPNVKNRIFRNLTDVGIAGGQEAIQEVVEGVLHGVNEIATSNPNAQLIEGLDREALAAGGTGIVMRSIINMITPGKGSVDPSFNASMKDSLLRMDSEMGQSLLDERIHYAQSSKTNERDSKRFERFIEGLDPDDFVYIRPEALSQIPGLPDYIIEQMDGTGANIAVPMGKFLTDIIKDKDLLEQIRPHVTMRENHQTETELSEGPVSPHVERLVANAQKHKESLDEADEIYEQVKDQVIGTLRQGEDTARMSAQLLPAMVVTQQANLAARGIDVGVKELYEKMGLSIIGPTGKVAPERTVIEQRKPLYQKEQDFGDLKFEDVIEDHKVVESAQKVWEFHQKRATTVEVLRECLAS